MPRKKTLHLARGLTLPLDYVTETFGFMARRKAGKTYCAQKLAEEMLDAGAQIVVLDPIGNWWSLRLSADGKGRGFDIPVFGGLRGDIPLSRDAGVLIADTVVDTGTSVVLDVSQLSKAAQRAFVADFCERLFSRRAAHPSATHIFFEECQSFAPQRFGAAEARMVGAVEDIVKKGRNFGLGATMISQRPQSVNKEIFNLVECLLMMQMNGPHERKTMRDWIDYKGVEAKEIIDELPTLKVGEAWVSSPQLGPPFKVKIEAKRTFDASSAPLVGSRARTKRLHKLDLAALESAMASVIEDKAANDPVALRRRIAELELELASKSAAPPAPDPEIEHLRSDLAVAQAEIDSLEVLVSQLRTGVALALSQLEETGGLQAPPIKLRKRAKEPRALPMAAHDRKPAKIPAEQRPELSLTAGDQEILDAVAWWESVGQSQPTRVQVSFLCNAHSRSKGHRNRVSALKSAGYLAYPLDGRLSLTPAGRPLAKSPPTPGTTVQLHQIIKGKLTPALRDVFNALAASYPGDLSRADLAIECGVHERSKGHRNNVSKLKGLGIVEYPASGRVRLSPSIFVENPG